MYDERPNSVHQKKIENIYLKFKPATVCNSIITQADMSAGFYPTIQCGSFTQLANYITTFFTGRLNFHKQRNFKGTAQKRAPTGQQMNFSLAWEKY